MQAFGTSGLVVRVRLEGMDQEILVDGRLQDVFWDPRPGRADLELYLPVDLLHRILMEEASFRKSFMNGDIRSQGNVFRAMPFAELLQAARSIYQDLDTRAP